ncbi:MAG: hypothetical protein WCG23_11825 [bacterium]
MKKTLRSRSGNLIGFIKEDSSGNKEIRSKNGNYLGKFNEKENKTYNKNGKFIGIGDFLTNLL